MKTCPDCAEDVKDAAKVCKHCGYRWPDAAAESPPPVVTAASDAEPSAQERRSGPPRWLFPVLGLFAVAALLAALLGDESTESLRVPSESMLPTYEVNDTVEVDTGADEFERGDVVVFFAPSGADLNQCGVEHPDNQPCPRPTSDRGEVQFIKRIVAVGGDRLSVRQGSVYIDGEPQDEDYAKPSADCPTCNMEKEITVPDGHYFMVGDNRGASADSREWGAVPEDWINGKVVE